MRRLVVMGPLPPPYHGVSVSTSLVLASKELPAHFDVHHVDTSDPRGRENIGRWDVTNVWLGLKATFELLRRMRGPRGVVYLPASANVPALMRDSLYIHAAALRRWKVVAHIRGSDIRPLYDRQPWPIQWWLRFTLRRLTSTAVMGESLRWLFDGLLDPDRVVVIPNGTPDLDLGERPPNGEVGLFFSNLRRRKGVVEALDAALLVLDEWPSAQFRFVGDWESPELERELRHRAGDAGDHITFGPVVAGDAKRDTLAAATYLIFPPVEPEGHPRVVLEAQAAGLPVVTTNRGAIAETVVHGETGYVLEDPDPRQMADLILTLLRDPDMRRRMSVAARARYLEHFTQEAADRRLAHWLRDVAEG